MHLLNWKTNSIKLNRSMFENIISMRILSSLIKLLSYLLKGCSVARILSTYSFQAPSSQNHASVKLAQACCKLNFFLRDLLFWLVVIRKVSCEVEMKSIEGKIAVTKKQTEDDRSWCIQKIPNLFNHSKTFLEGTLKTSLC